MPTRCPKCGSASSQRVAPARIAAGRMKDPAFLAMLAVNATDAKEMGRATAPNSPDRACSSCSAGFRARPTRCPGCGSARLARVVYRGEWDRGAEGGPESGEATEEETLLVRAKQGLRWNGAGGVDAEILRLLNSRAEAVASWKALQAELGFVSLPYSGTVNRPTLACAECSGTFRPRPTRCPRCGSTEIARIQYGYPAGMPDRRDRVVLGGCCVSPDDPGMECEACGHGFGKSGF